MKSDTVKTKEVIPVPKVAKMEVKDEYDHMSVKEMKGEKRRHADDKPELKKQKLQNISTQKFQQKDYKIFGADKFQNKGKR